MQNGDWFQENAPAGGNGVTQGPDGTLYGPDGQPIPDTGPGGIGGPRNAGTTITGAPAASPSPAAGTRAPTSIFATKGTDDFAPTYTQGSSWFDHPGGKLIRTVPLDMSTLGSGPKPAPGDDKKNPDPNSDPNSDPNNDPTKRFPAPLPPNPNAFPAPTVPTLIPLPPPINPWTEEFKAPNPSDVLADPVLQAALGEGIKQIERGAASRGTLLTGGTLKGVQDYTTSKANDFYKDAYGRAFNEYDTRRTNFLTNESNRFNSARSNVLDTFAQEGGIWNMENLNRMNSWQLASNFFDQGRANRLDNFGIFRTANNDDWARNFDMATLGKPPVPQNG